MPTVGYLGPKGTFSDVGLTAYLNYHQLSYDCCSFSSFFSLFQALDTQDVTHIFIPIENSLGGEVYSTLDGLLTLSNSYGVSAECVLLIKQSLIGPRICDFLDIRVIYSHEQSVSQCQQFLNKFCPNADIVCCSSNAMAAQRVQRSDSVEACIGHQLLGEYYDLTVLQSDINDSDNNMTRFVMISSEISEKTGQDKSSFIFSSEKDAPGSLCDILSQLSRRHINLTRITSRPSKGLLGDYVFFVDCEGHCQEDPLKEVLGLIQQKSSFFKFLGSYQKGMMYD